MGEKKKFCKNKKIFYFIDYWKVMFWSLLVVGVELMVYWVYLLDFWGVFILSILDVIWKYIIY